MKLDSVKAWLGLPALVVGSLLALGTFAGWFGFGVRTPASDFSRLERVQAEYHRAADSLHETTADVVGHLYDESEKASGLTETLIVRFCLRDSYEELVLQRLIQTCKELGIHREAGDRGVRSAVGSDSIN